MIGWLFQHLALNVEQRHFAVQAASITGQRAVSPKYPMAGNNNTDRVVSDGTPQRTNRFGISYACAQTTVAGGFAARYFKQCAPDHLLKWCASAQIQRYAECSRRPCEVPAQFRPGLLKKAVFGLACPLTGIGQITLAVNKPCATQAPF